LFKLIPALSIAAFAMLAALFVGCTPPAPTPLPPPPPKPYASTQTADVVAELEKLQITRGELDHLLYQSFGLRMLFDIVELHLAEDTLKSRGLTITQSDLDAERKHIIDGIRGDAAESDGENLFNQFLQQQHIPKAEFDIKVIQTDAILRKIATPLIVGKLNDETVHRAFEQLYGAKRKIADIQLLNVREASIAAKRLKSEPFAKVAREMSVDEKTKGVGGEWDNAFTTQSAWVPQAIRDQAFAMDKGQISDIINTEDAKYHIITVLEMIPPDPKIVSYDQVKDAVRKQLEDQLVVNAMKIERSELASKTQQELVLDEPTLKAEWDALLDEQLGKNRNREEARKALNEQAAKAATQPATVPSSAPPTTAP
jgi:hypothetical protein